MKSISLHIRSISSLNADADRLTTTKVFSGRDVPDKCSSVLFRAVDGRGDQKMPSGAGPMICCRRDRYPWDNASLHRGINAKSFFSCSDIEDSKHRANSLRNDSEDRFSSLSMVARPNSVGRCRPLSTVQRFLKSGLSCRQVAPTIWLCSQSEAVRSLPWRTNADCVLSSFRRKLGGIPSAMGLELKIGTHLPSA